METPRTTNAADPGTTAEFLGMAPAEGGREWRLPIGGRAVGGGRGSLFGGVGLAAGIVALEGAAAKPVVWATGQYSSTLFAPSQLDLSVHLPAIGRTVTQAHVVGRSDGAEIIAVLGAAGVRTERARRIGDPFPGAPSPAVCPDVERDFEYESIHDHVEIRVARGMFGFTGVGEPSGDHRTLLWARFTDVGLDRAGLAILADFGPSALGNAIGRIANLTSLDNTIRFADPVPNGTDWVLLDNRTDFVGNGFAHGSTSIWSESGVLLATASQSATVVLLD